MNAYKMYLNIDEMDLKTYMDANGIALMDEPFEEIKNMHRGVSEELKILQKKVESGKINSNLPIMNDLKDIKIDDYPLKKIINNYDNIIRKYSNQINKEIIQYKPLEYFDRLIREGRIAFDMDDRPDDLPF